MTRVLFVVAARWENWGKPQPAAKGRYDQSVLMRNLAGDTVSLDPDDVGAFLAAQTEPYGQPSPYGVGPYGPDPYGPYGPDPYGAGPYGPNPYGVGPYGPDPYGPPDPDSPDPYGVDPYGPGPYSPEPEPYGPWPLGSHANSVSIGAAPSLRSAPARAAGAGGGAPTSGRVPLSSGLRNSIVFQASMLNSLGITAKVAEVPSWQYATPEIAKFRPTHVIVEAIWMMPEVFDELRKRFPHVRFAVRNHSSIPFLAGEFSAFRFIGGYLDRGVEVMSNDARTVEDLRIFAHSRNRSENLVTYAPNFYPPPGHDQIRPSRSRNKQFLDVALFGAVRPLKNHVLQALAAIHFADQLGKTLRLHVNATRVEMRAESMMNNLRNAFKGSKHSLIEHGWAPHSEFRKLIAGMDYCLQCNNAETYNIVSADAASESVPIIVTAEVPWVRSYAWADCTRSHSISRLMDTIWWETDEEFCLRIHSQRRDMHAFSHRTEAIWMEKFGRFSKADIPAERFV